jgi:acyl carrier protein
MSAPPSEPDTVESLLRAHPDVVDVAALRGPDGRRVAAVVPGPSAVVADLRDHLWAVLDPADLPDALVSVEALHRDATGAVAAAEAARIAREADLPGGHTFRAPQTPTQRQLAEIWGETLGRARIGADDNFLDLGGDSMTAAMLLDLTNERFGVELTLGDLLSAPSLAAVAEAVDRLRPGP